MPSAESPSGEVWPVLKGDLPALPPLREELGGLGVSPYSSKCIPTKLCCSHDDLHAAPCPRVLFGILGLLVPMVQGTPHKVPRLLLSPEEFGPSTGKGLESVTFVKMERARPPAMDSPFGPSGLLGQRRLSRKEEAKPGEKRKARSPSGHGQRPKTPRDRNKNDRKEFGGTQ